MASTIALIADSLSALAPVRVWECLRCGKRWATDTETGCPYCAEEAKRAIEGNHATLPGTFN